MANAASDDVSAYTVNAATGVLTSIGAPVAAGSSPNSVTVDPSGRFAYVANSGPTTSRPTPSPPTGALTGIAHASRRGPVHLGHHRPDGQVRLRGEYDHQRCLGIRHRRNDRGTHQPRRAHRRGVLSLLRRRRPVGQVRLCGEPASNDVSAFAINTTTGALTSLGVVPAEPSTSVAVDPSGKFAYVTNFLSDDVWAYTINATTGVLTNFGAPVAAGSAPNSITIDPSGRFAYVANDGSDDVSGFSIDAASGALASIGAPVAAGTEPISVTTTGTWH